MDDLSFSPHQRERLSGCLKALRENRIGLRKSRTRLFPYNLSTSIFVHLLEDALSGLPRVLGFRAVDEFGQVTDAAAWTVVDEEEMELVWEQFSERFLVVWRKAVRHGKGPHLFHFGEKIWRGLQEWGELAGEANRLSFLWTSGRLHRTDIRRLVREHFDFPAPGKLTLFALSWILGIASNGARGMRDFLDRAPESLFHDDPEPFLAQKAWARDSQLREDAVRRVERVLETESLIWAWAHRHLESDLEQIEWGEKIDQGDHATGYLHFLEEERRLREEDILTLQEYSLEERIERFRAIGPLSFLGTSLDEEGRFLLDFQLADEAGLSKFREDDFLKLAPVGSRDLQSGFPVILARYDHAAGKLSVLLRQGRPALSKRLAYSLEEDLTDWNHPKLVHAVQTVLSSGASGKEHSVSKLLAGRWTMDRGHGRLSWVRGWIDGFEPVSSLNAAQRKALELPFRKRLALVEGPPGTGKTHLLGWIIISMILEARQSGEPLRILVSALTHQAIDGVLRKVVELVNRYRIDGFPGRILKWGRWKEANDEGFGAAEEENCLKVQPLNGPDEIRRHPHLVLGATGFGLYNLFGSQTRGFPRVFDWVIFDEASQILVPHALLGMAYGRDRYLFLGDVMQLPPIVLGTRDESSQAACAAFSDPSRSILAHLLDCYGAENRVRLDVTYRMNEELCAFPSRMWYGGALRPDESNARRTLDLMAVREQTPSPQRARSSSDSPIHRLTHSPIDLDRILDPQKPVTLVLTDHRGCCQKSDVEVEVIAQLACRLMGFYGLVASQLAVISPHRAQNNTIADRLRRLLGAGGSMLPVIDTVERVQGAERDVILFSITASDPDCMMGPFLNNPNRFNVAITRAKRKLIVVGSHAFFRAVPNSEEALAANRCFQVFHQFCRERDAVISADTS